MSATNLRIILFKHHDLLSFAIKAVTRGQYVHAAVLADEGTLEIYEAFYPCVRKRALTNEELDSIDAFMIQGFTSDMEQRAVRWMDAQVAAHARYSIMDLFRFLPEARAVLGEPSPAAQCHTMFCSMFAFQAIHAGGIQLLNAASYEIAPSHLAWSPYLVPMPALSPLNT